MILVGISLFVLSDLSVSRQKRFECSCCQFMVDKILGQRLYCYLFVVYSSPSSDDKVFEFDCLCEAMRFIQSVDPKSVFCIEGDFNCHHSEKLGSRITDAHGEAAFASSPLLSTVLSWTMSRPTHRAGGVFDLVLTNVPDLSDVSVQGNIRRSDHASLEIALNLSSTVAVFDVACRVPLKSRAILNGTCEALS